MVDGLDPEGFVMYRLFRDATKYEKGTHQKVFTAQISCDSLLVPLLTLRKPKLVVCHKLVCSTVNVSLQEMENVIRQTTS